jgi:hypothetical protein
LIENTNQNQASRIQIYDLPGIKNDAGLGISTESGLPERIWRNLEEDNIQ